MDLPVNTRPHMTNEMKELLASFKWHVLNAPVYTAALSEYYLLGSLGLYMQLGRGFQLMRM